MEHVEMRDASRLFLQDNLVGMLGILQNNKHNMPPLIMKIVTGKVNKLVYGIGLGCFPKIHIFPLYLDTENLISTRN